MIVNVDAFDQQLIFSAIRAYASLYARMSRSCLIEGSLKRCYSLKAERLQKIAERLERQNGANFKFHNDGIA